MTLKTQQVDYGLAASPASCRIHEFRLVDSGYHTKYFHFKSIKITFLSPRLLPSNACFCAAESSFTEALSVRMCTCSVTNPLCQVYSAWMVLFKNQLSFVLLFGVVLVTPRVVSILSLFNE